MNFGWGTAPEQGYSGQFQRGANGATEVAYFGAPDGRIIRFAASGGSYSWSDVGP